MYIGDQIGLLKSIGLPEGCGVSDRPQLLVIPFDLRHVSVVKV